MAGDHGLAAGDPGFDQAAFVVANVLRAALVAEVDLDPRDLIGERASAFEMVVSTWRASMRAPIASVEAVLRARMSRAA